MGLFKMNVTKNLGEYHYPVDPYKITAVKYKKDMSECVCSYPADAIEHPDVVAITQEEYNRYGALQIALNKPQVIADNTDTAVITVTVPEGEDTVRLLIDDVVSKVKQTVNGEATFEILADPETAGDVVKLQADSDLWAPDRAMYLEVVPSA